MIIGLPPSLLSVGGVVILSLLPLGPFSWTRVVLVDHYLTLVGVAPPFLFDQALGDLGLPMVLCPLGDLVKGPACLL